MTKLLQKAFEEASRLPEEDQDSFAQALLSDLASEERWAELFAKSQDKLAALAKEALIELKQGKTKLIEANSDFSRLRDSGKPFSARFDIIPWQGSNVIKKITMTELKERITINPEQCGGRPCIRGMRIRVIDILDLYAAGLTAQEILDEMPDLEMEDLSAALRYAAHRLDHPVIAA
jgi:uncharacterized protein (DUF433 family)